MSEITDPYFAGRLEQAKAHRVLEVIKIPEHQLREAEPNKELSNPTIEGHIDDFGWSEKAVDNLINAAEKGHLHIVSFEKDQLIVELLPIPVKDLPAELGQVCEMPVLDKNLAGSERLVFGSDEERDLTYLQTTDFAVEGFMDDEAEGHKYARIFVDTAALDEQRNIYLDPESINITDYEYGHAFCVFSGLPFKSINRIEIIRAKKIRFDGFGDFPSIDDDFDIEAETDKQTQRLRDFLQTREAA